MKRSDALIAIKNYLESFESPYDLLEDTIITADQILHILEKKGMTPPAIAIREKHPAIDAWGDDIGGYYVSVELKNQWEKEDET